MQPSATIVIPTYNGAARIGEVLDALALQSTSSFEVVVVDNNSTDGTSAVVREHPAWRKLGASGVECRVVLEPQQGLLFGRIRGVQEAKAPFVCFLDDDNLPAANYVRLGTEVLETNPDVGLLVSRVRPRYEAVPRPSVAKREHLFAVNYRLGDARIDLGASGTLAPTLGAGMWLRRSAFLAAVPWQHTELLISDRIGSALVSGNDIEIGFLLGRAGFRRLYCPELELVHAIPRSRLETRYVARLIIGVVRSTITLDHRYQLRRYGRRARAAALCQLAFAALATPALALRPDGLCETVFVLASRWARVRGPFP